MTTRITGNNIAAGSITTTQLSTVIVNTLVQADSATSSPPALYTKILNFDGTVVVGTGTARWYPDTAITIANAYIISNTPTTTGNLTLQINKNGSSIFSYANLTVGNYRSNTYTINTAVDTTDYITVDVITSSGAADASLTLTYTRN